MIFDVEVVICDKQDYLTRIIGDNAIVVNYPLDG